MALREYRVVQLPSGDWKAQFRELQNGHWFPWENIDAPHCDTELEAEKICDRHANPVIREYKPK